MKDHLKEVFIDRFTYTDQTTLFGKLSSLFSYSPDLRNKKRCENAIIEIKEMSGEVKLLIGAMKKHGCNFDLARHVSCERCKGCAGGYDPDTNQIVICENRVSARKDMHNVLIHEMIHMFDFCRANLDFDNLEHIACSEIRAANLTHCNLLERFRFGGPLYQWSRSHQTCVKEIAYASLAGYSPDTDPKKLWDIIDKVFVQCYFDMEPFGRRPMGNREPFKHSYRERYHYNYFE